MRYLGIASLSLALAAADAGRGSAASETALSVAPALEGYTSVTLEGDVWQRPDLSPRDRSVVTLAVLIARNQSTTLPAEFDRALDNGLTPLELSEIITHLAFYAGWGNATSAAAVAQVAFGAHGVTAEALVAPAEPLPLDEASEAARQENVQANFGAVSQGIVDDTRDVLFRDLWLRPGLAPRDRSLVTVSALVANGQVAQVPYHLGRAMDNGLTQAEAAGALNHLAYYAGWPNVFSALPVAREVFQSRSKR